MVSQRVYFIKYREELGSYDAIPDETIAFFLKNIIIFIIETLKIFLMILILI